MGTQAKISFLRFWQEMEMWICSQERPQAQLFKARYWEVDWKADRKNLRVTLSGQTDGRTYPMIGLEIINLLLEEDGPQVFAEEFDHV